MSRNCKFSNTLRAFHETIETTVAFPPYPLHSPLRGVSNVRNDAKSNNVQGNGKKSTSGRGVGRTEYKKEIVPTITMRR